MKKKFEKLSKIIDRIISGSMKNQILFFLLIVVVVFVVLFTIRIILFSPSSPETDNSQWFWDTLKYYIDPGVELVEHNTLEKLFRVVMIMLRMVLFAGVLIALLVNIIFQRIENVKNGEVYYNFSDHVVIIGCDHICIGLARQIAEQSEVVLQTSMDVQTVRHDLFLGINDKLKKNIIIVNGNRVSRDDMQKLNIDKSKQVFLLGEINEDDHDSRNIESLGIINEIAAKAGRSIRCHVLFKNHLTFYAFQQQEIPGIRKNIDFVPFNFENMWAQKIFVENEYDKGRVVYRPLDHEPITADSTKRVHLVILGMSDMGIALALQAAHICHFPNFITKGIKTRITFIDVDAEKKMNLLKVRLRNLFNEIDYTYRDFDTPHLDALVSKKSTFTDIEFEFIKDHFEDDALQNYLEEAAGDKDSYLTIAITIPDSSAALSAALCLPQVVYDSEASVLIRQTHTNAIVSMLSSNEEENYCEYKNLRPYGMLYNSYDLKQTDDLLPMMVKYTYDNTTEKTTIKEFQIDKIRRNWIENWRKSDNVSALKASCRFAANFIPIKQRSLGIQEGVDLNPQQINLAARIEHNRWLTEKLILDFRAPTQQEAEEIVKDKSKREYYKARFIHPDIKAYQALETDDKGIDVKLYDISISNTLPYMIKVYKGEKK